MHQLSPSFGGLDFKDVAAGWAAAWLESFFAERLGHEFATQPRSLVLTYDHFAHSNPLVSRSQEKKLKTQYIVVERNFYEGVSGQFREAFGRFFLRAESFYHTPPRVNSNFSFLQPERRLSR
jgi:hypothetical protein